MEQDNWQRLSCSILIRNKIQIMPYLTIQFFSPENYNEIRLQGGPVQRKSAVHIKAYLINKSSQTPLIMYYVMKKEFPYRMMVTESHNPAIYNGIKVFKT